MSKRGFPLFEKMGGTIASHNVYANKISENAYFIMKKYKLLKKEGEMMQKEPPNKEGEMNAQRVQTIYHARECGGSGGRGHHRRVI
jgi:hypothetical protein